MLQNVRLQKQGKNSKLKKMMKPRLRDIEDERVKILAESSFTNGVWRIPGNIRLEFCDEKRLWCRFQNKKILRLQSGEFYT